MQIRNIISYVALILCLTALACYYLQPKENPASHQEPNPDLIPIEQVNVIARNYQPQLEAVLQNKIKLLSKKLHQNMIIESLIKYNAQHADLDIAYINELDTTWRSSQSMTESDNALINQKCSNVLTQIQQKQPEISEMFITSVKGLNVCQTNKTSDYYQADESWWKHAFVSKTYIGQIEYDHSAKKQSIPIYLSIFEPKTNTLVGIVKVVLDINKIGREL